MKYFVLVVSVIYLFAVLAGISFAQNKVVVIPVLNAEKTEPSNGDFESTWYEAGLPIRRLVVHWESPHSGIAHAVLVDGNDQTGYIYREVKVTSQQLVFYQKIQSDDACSINYDTGKVEINNVALETFILCRDTKTNGWEKVTINVSAYVNQTVQLQFKGSTDTTSPSKWEVDTIQFK